MYTIPPKINLACLPTKIEKLEKISAEYHKNIYIKRDDLTGMELSGNKVRKLEYSIAEALEQGADTLITCGALQSNHCRATAAAAAKLGLKSVLVLKDGEKQPPAGNYLLDRILDADIRLISPESYKDVNQIMQNIAEELAAQNRKAYIIPMGASNAIGMFGYIEAVKEIFMQEKELGIHFDAIIDTVGSTGTFAGLVLGSIIYNAGYGIVGFSVGEDREYFQNISYKNIIECCKYLSNNKCTHTPESLGVKKEDLKIIDLYRGAGYGLNCAEDFEVIKHLARQEGIFVDSVYTGKAFKGMLSEIRYSESKASKAENSGFHADFSKYDNILFIHTGGLFGLFPKAEEMSKYL